MNIVRWMTTVLFSSICIYKYVIRETGNIFSPSSPRTGKGVISIYYVIIVVHSATAATVAEGVEWTLAADLAVCCDDSSRSAAATTLGKSRTGAPASPPPKSLWRYIPFAIYKQYIILYRSLNELDLYFFLHFLRSSTLVWLKVKNNNNTNDSWHAIRTYDKAIAWSHGLHLYIILCIWHWW
jgi:hypothetical protein